MSLNKFKVRQHFDRHAASYEQYACVQKQLANRLIQSLRKKKPSSNSPLTILEIGCGTGYLTKLLLKQYPSAQLTVIDISKRMLEQARTNLSNHSHRVSYIHADAEELAISDARTDTTPCGGRYELIISNATFQWFNDPRSTLKAFLRWLTPTGCLAFTTFGPRTFEELHQAYAMAEVELGIEPAQRGQIFLGLQEWSSMLNHVQHEFFLHEELYTEYFPEVRSFLHSIQRIGAGNALKSSSPTMGGRTLLKTMEEHYTTTYKSKKGIPAVYHVIQAICVKKQYKK